MSTSNDEFDDLMNDSDDELEYLMTSVQEELGDIGRTGDDEILLSDGIDGLDQELEAYLEEFTEDMLDEADMTATTFDDSTLSSTPKTRSTPDTPLSSPRSTLKLRIQEGRTPVRQHSIQNNVGYPRPRLASQEAPPGTTMATTTSLKESLVSNTILPSPATIQAFHALNYDSPTVARQQRRPAPRSLPPQQYRFTTPFKPHQKASARSHQSLQSANTKNVGLATKAISVPVQPVSNSRSLNDLVMEGDRPSPNKRPRLERPEQADGHHRDFQDYLDQPPKPHLGDARPVPPSLSKALSSSKSPSRVSTSNALKSPSSPPLPRVTNEKNGLHNARPREMEPHPPNNGPKRPLLPPQLNGASVLLGDAQQARKLMPPPPSPSKVSVPPPSARPTRSNHPPLDPSGSASKPTIPRPSLQSFAKPELQPPPSPKEDPAATPKLLPTEREPVIKLEPATQLSFPKMSSQEARMVKRELDAEEAEREIHYRREYLESIGRKPSRPIRASTMIYKQMCKRDEDAKKRMEQWRAEQAEKELDELIGTPTMEDDKVWVCVLDTEKWELLYGKGSLGDWSLGGSEDVEEMEGAVKPKGID